MPTMKRINISMTLKKFPGLFLLLKPQAIIDLLSVTIDHFAFLYFYTNGIIHSVLFVSVLSCFT